MVDQGLISVYIFNDSLTDLIERGSFGASSIRTSVWCSLAVFFVRRKNITVETNIICLWLFIVVFYIKVDKVCYQFEEPFIKPASCPLYNFGGYPKSLKWSSQSRPMTDLVRKIRPKTPDDHHFFWVCNKPTWVDTVHGTESNRGIPGRILFPIFYDNTTLAFLYLCLWFAWVWEMKNMQGSHKKLDTQSVSL